MDEAERCHRLALLRDGRRVALGSPTDLTRPLAARVLDVEVANAERAVTVLKTAPLVASTTRLGDRVHVLLVRTAPPASQAAPEIARLLRDAGVDGASVSPSEPTLEDVFVAILLGERIEPEAGGRR
jgi:ABC-2 type transport system ATP-binding protein